MSVLYYLQDARGFVGNACLWWCPEGKGYTIHLDEAGTFTEEEAFRQHRDRPSDRPVAVDIARAAASLQVDAQRLAKAKDSAASIAPADAFDYDDQSDAGIR